MRGIGVTVALAAALVVAGAALALTPNDPLWQQSWPQRLVGMPRAWDVTTGSSKIVVAVVDTGIQPRTDDLRGAVVPGWDFINNDSNPQDLEGHGTMVATIIAGRGNDGVGVAGYCWKCKIMPLRVSARGYASSRAIAQAIDYAAAHGARVVNIDFNDGGTYAEDPVLTRAIADAAAKNVVVVTSAGNSGNDRASHPASAAGALPVAATKRDDTLTSYTTRGNWVQLAAPGCQISVNQKGKYGKYCGTSSAAPAVSGIVALMLSAKPQLTPAQVRDALRSTSRPVVGIGGGRIDAYRALVAVGAVPGASLTPQTPGPKPGRGKVKAKKVVHGRLATHRRIPLVVQGGRVSLALSSPVAHACYFTLGARGDVWFSEQKRRSLLRLIATVPGGRYNVDIRCTGARRARFTFTARALFG